MNWGWKLVIGSALFMAMIIYFVVQSFQNETHLVSKDYYEEELNFQNKMEATQNAIELDTVLQFEMVGDQIHVFYPSFFVGNGSEGNILFYKPSNAHHDKSFQCNMNKSQQIIAKSNFEKGRYFAKASLNKEGKEYYFEQRIKID